MSSKYTKERLEAAAKNNVSIAGVLRYLNIKQAGGSQTHIKNMMCKYDIDCSHFTGQAVNRGSKSPLKRTAKDVLVKHAITHIF